MPLNPEGMEAEEKRAKDAYFERWIQERLAPAERR
jgi:hypothetical protein